MRFEGVVKSWNEERGFGFIEPVQGGQDVFVHITALPARAGRPAVKQRVSFELELNHEGKKRAKNVRPVVAARTPRPRSRSSAAEWGGASLFAVPAFVILFVAMAVLWRVPRSVAVAYLVLGVLCYFMYWKDKSAAVAGRRRTAESTLLLIGLLGGWPGGLLAQQFLRHKSAKASFRSAFWGTVAFNVCAFVALSSPVLGEWQWLT